MSMLEVCPGAGSLSRLEVHSRLPSLGHCMEEHEIYLNMAPVLSSFRPYNPDYPRS